MVEFGRIGNVTKREIMVGKVDQRGIKMIMVGYAPGHASDVYHMYNPITKRIILTQDVTWAAWHHEDPIGNAKLFSTYKNTTTDMDEVYVTIYLLGTQTVHKKVSPKILALLQTIQEQKS